MPLGESLKVHSELTAHSWLKRLGDKAEIHSVSADVRPVLPGPGPGP